MVFASPTSVCDLGGYLEQIVVADVSVNFRHLGSWRILLFDNLMGDG